MNSDFFKGNRDRFAELMEDQSVALFFSGNPPRSSGDQFYSYEPDRNFFYLSGLDTPNLALVITKKGGKSEQILLLPPVNERMERSNGPAMRPDEAKKIGGFDAALYESCELKLLEYMNSESGRGYKNVYLDYIPYPAEQSHLSHIVSLIGNNCPYAAIMNAAPIVHGLRFIKQEAEIECIRRAIALTNEGLKNALLGMEDGKPEYGVKMDFEEPILRKNKGIGFHTIVAAGMNATTLHHTPGTSHCREGEITLFDCGAQDSFYSADISRTFPVSGKFSERQKLIYEIVLGAELDCISKMKAGATFKSITEASENYCAKELIRIGLLKEGEDVKKYHYHGVCHPLGLDVHDVHADGETGTKLAEGVVCTIEPGLYIREWGFGVRIEDDVLIKAVGNEVLSAEIIKTVEDIEKFAGQR